MDSRTSGFVDSDGTRLHYLDWGGSGPAMVFLAGMASSAFIFDGFAPRFTDRFRVVGLTRRGHGDSDHPDDGYDAPTLIEDLRRFMDALGIREAILVGHSMANVELCGFCASYPRRVLKLVFLDSAYERSEMMALEEKNPLRLIDRPRPKGAFSSVEAMMAYNKRILPHLLPIWGDAMEEDFRHAVERAPDGTFTYKMNDGIAQALFVNLTAYVPEYDSLDVPVLSIFSIQDNFTHELPEYLTLEQRTAAIEFMETVMLPAQRTAIDRFRLAVPHAKIIEIRQGHHYCFIREAGLVFDEMRRFLLD